MIPQNVTCQDLLQDETVWKSVAQKVKNDWTRCLTELQAFEDLLEQDRLKRFRWARMFRLFGFGLTFIQNVVAGVTAAIPLSIVDAPPTVGYVLSGVTFILSLTLWSRLGERSHKYLDIAKDSERLQMMCKNIRKMLKDIIADGQITEQERNLIRDMIGQMHRKSEEISTMDLFLKLLGGGDDQSMVNQKDAKFNIFNPSTNNYNIALSGVSDIIDEITKTQKEIATRIPHVVREYQNAQLQSQMHSIGVHI